MQESKAVPFSFLGGSWANFDWKKLFLGGIAAAAAIFVVSFIADAIIAALFPYDILSLGETHAADYPFMTLFFFYPLVLGFAMSAAFSKFKDCFRSTGFCRGKAFGFYAWLLAGLPSAFIVYTGTSYPTGFAIRSLPGSLFYGGCSRPCFGKGCSPIILLRALNSQAFPGHLPGNCIFLLLLACHIFV